MEGGDPLEQRTIKPLARRLCEGALGLYGLRDAHLEPLVGASWKFTARELQMGKTSSSGSTACPASTKRRCARTPGCVPDPACAPPIRSARSCRGWLRLRRNGAARARADAHVGRLASGACIGRGDANRTPLRAVAVDAGRPQAPRPLPRGPLAVRLVRRHDARPLRAPSRPGNRRLSPGGITPGRSGIRPPCGRRAGGSTRRKRWGCSRRRRNVRRRF